jgi:hypothetical protein
MWYWDYWWYDSEIRAATISATGEVLVPTETLVEDARVFSDGLFRPSPLRIFCDREEPGCFMTWTEDPLSSEEVVVTGVLISPQGVAGTPFPIGAGELRDMIYNPTAREYLLAMSVGDDGPDLGLRLSPTGEPLADPFPLARGGAGDRIVKLVFNPDANQYLSVNLSGNTGTESDPSREIYAGIFAPDGAPQGEAFTVMGLSGGLDSDLWYVEDRVLAGYLPGGQNYVVFVQLEHAIGSLRLQQTYGQRVSPSGDLLGGSYLVSTELTSLCCFHPPRPALVVDPAAGNARLVYYLLHAILASQGLTATGTPLGPIEILAMTDLPSTFLGSASYPATEITVIPSSETPKGLALWNKVMFGLGGWADSDYATYGMIIDLF